MAEHQNPCAICAQIESALRGEHAGFIAETETGIVVLGEHQQWRGYCVLLCKTPATELHELPRATKMKFLEEMSLLAQAIFNVTKCHKLNYEMLGNVAYHLHFHVFPRYENEENALKPVWSLMPPSAAPEHKPDAIRDAHLIEELRAELGRLLNEPEA